MGTATALPPARRLRGPPVTTPMLRLMTLTMMVFLPGGLLVLGAYMLARTVATQMRLEQGTGGRRFARAVSAVRLRDVWSHTRQSFRAS